MDKSRRHDALAKQDSDPESLRPTRIASPDEMSEYLKRTKRTAHSSTPESTNPASAISGTYAVSPEEESDALSVIGETTRGQISGQYLKPQGITLPPPQMTSEPPPRQGSDPEYILESHLINRIHSVFRIYLNIIESEKPALMSSEILDIFIYAFRQIITAYFKIYQAGFHAKVAFGIEGRLQELMQTKGNWKDRVSVEFMMEQISEIFALPAEAFENTGKKKPGNK
jgi:hypothetical protein